MSFFEYISPFCFLSIEFHCSFFPFLIKYYHILFIIIVFRLGSDKLVSCFFYCLSQGISHGMIGGGWMIFHFRLFKSIWFFVNRNSLYFFHLLYSTSICI